MILFEKLRDFGAVVEYHDTIIPVIPPTREHASLTGLVSVPLTEAQLATYDAVLIATEHSAVDYGFVAKHSKLVVDTRNATRGIADTARIVKA